MRINSNAYWHTHNFKADHARPRIRSASPVQAGLSRFVACESHVALRNERRVFVFPYVRECCMVSYAERVAAADAAQRMQYTVSTL